MLVGGGRGVQNDVNVGDVRKLTKEGVLVVVVELEDTEYVHVNVNVWLTPPPVNCPLSIVLGIPHFHFRKNQTVSTHSSIVHIDAPVAQVTLRRFERRGEMITSGSMVMRWTSVGSYALKPFPSVGAKLL